MNLDTLTKTNMKKWQKRQYAQSAMCIFVPYDNNSLMQAMSSSFFLELIKQNRK